jgi:uncharacterized protein (TIGR01777 family)
MEMIPSAEILIYGATGLIGTALTAELTRRGHVITVVARDITKARTRLTRSAYVVAPVDLELSGRDVRKPDVVINLAGESIGDGRWTPERRDSIVRSREQAVDLLLRFVTRYELHPAWINASAIGFYGMHAERTFTEMDTEPGSDFLAQTCVSWEAAAQRAAEVCRRVVVARFGVVLARKGGALPRMLLPYRFGVGGPVGSGRQWVSWIHLRDAAAAVSLLVEREDLRGPFNLTAPAPVTNTELGKAIADALRKPHWLPVPSLALRLALGEMADLVLRGQRVLPQRLQDAGYAFAFTDVHAALIDLLR